MSDALGAGAGALSLISYAAQCYFERSQSHRLDASITFLFHLGGLLGFPFGISSMTDIVAPEILRGDFLDAQNLSPCFIFCCRISYAFISSYVSNDVLRLLSINGPPDLIVGVHDETEIDFTWDEKLLSWFFLIDHTVVWRIDLGW